jgi:hypothetical protein
MYSVLNCHNVARHTEFYLGLLRFNVTSTGNAGCFKRSFTLVFQMLLCGEYYENVKCKREDYLTVSYEYVLEGVLT